MLCFFPGCTDNSPKETKELNLWFVSANGYSIGEEDLSGTLQAYQKNYPDIQLNIVRKDVEKPEDKRDYYTELETTLMSGGGPDIIYMGEMFPQINDVYKMQQAGVFADLTEFIENDPDINWDNYNQSILKLSNYKGKQYIMPLSYSLPLFMSTRDVLDKAGVDERDFANTQGMMQEVMDYWERNGYDPSCPGFFSVSYVFNFFSSFMGLNIANHVEQKSNFETEHTQQVLEFLKTTYPVELGRVYDMEESSEFYDLSMSLGAAKESFEHNAQVTCMDRVGLQGYFGNISALETIGEPVVFPMRDSNGGIQACVMRALMISSTSKNKMNAWNFIKTALAAEQQRSFTEVEFTRDNIPVNKAIWREIYESQYQKDFEYFYKDYATGKPVEEKYYDQFLNLQEEISGVFLRYPAEKKVIEKLIPYFEGKKSYEEVAKDVQGYLNIYLSE